MVDHDTNDALGKAYKRRRKEGEEEQAFQINEEVADQFVLICPEEDCDGLRKPWESVALVKGTK